MLVFKGSFNSEFNLESKKMEVFIIFPVLAPLCDCGGRQLWDKRVTVWEDIMHPTGIVDAQIKLLLMEE